MFSTTWQTSPRQHGVVRDRHVGITTSEGVRLDADVFRPDAEGRFPVILSLAPYPVDDEVAPISPGPMRYPNAHIESGDPHFFVRRGYVHVIGNLPGTGASEGWFDHMGPHTIRAVYDAIAWCAEQPWSDGNVGMFGMSYYGMIQPLVAMLEPPALKALFCPFAVTDQYRDTYYKGGIFGYAFIKGWSVALRRARVRATFAESVGEERFAELVEAAKRDPEIAQVPAVMEVLNGVDDPVNRFLAELVVNPLLTEHYEPRNVDYTRGCSVPAYFGACWGMYGLHQPGAFRSFTRWNGPARLTIGPPAYLDRPVVQYQDESLRWFDHWLKGNDTGLLDEPPVQLFVDGANDWRQAHEWPLPETRFTEFLLHEGGLLFEGAVAERAARRHHRLAVPARPRGVLDACVPRRRRALRTGRADGVRLDDRHRRPALCVAVRRLAGRRRAADQPRLAPRLAARARRGGVDPLAPGACPPRACAAGAQEIVRLDVDIRPVGVLLRSGSRLKLVLRTTDEGDPNADILSNHAVGLLAGAEHNRVFVHHDEDHPSALVLPVTKGNRIGTFLSGGRLEPLENAWGGSAH